MPKENEVKKFEVYKVVKCKMKDVKVGEHFITVQDGVVSPAKLLVLPDIPINKG